MQMYIQWHEPKRRQNLRAHGIDFADLAHFFDGDLYTREDFRYAYSERRFQSIGMLKGFALFVVWTPTGTAEDDIHLISARRARRHETQDWFTFYPRRH